MTKKKTTKQAQNRRGPKVKPGKLVYMALRFENQAQADAVACLTPQERGKRLSGTWSAPSDFSDPRLA